MRNLVNLAPMRLACLCLGLLASIATADSAKVVFIAGRPSHGPLDHEHRAGHLLLAEALNAADIGVEAVVLPDAGYPKDPTVLDGAATIVINCDGHGQHLLNPHLAAFDKLMEQGTGLVLMHWATEAVRGDPGDHFLKWIGGFCDLNWSINPHWTPTFKPTDHPIWQGVQPFTIHDEWYYHMRFVEDRSGFTPILSDLPPASTLGRDGARSGNPFVRKAVAAGESQHVAWAYQRGKGRGFGFTGGHKHLNWQDDNVRTLMLNAIVWTANVAIPANGVPSATPSDDAMYANLDPKGAPPKRPKPKAKPMVLKPTPAESGPIFDGKTLARWQGTPGVWRVEDGAITGSIAAGAKLSKNEFIYFESPLSDFDLRLDYRISGPKANSGIQFRSSRDASGHAAGYQADLDDGAVWLGRIYDEHGRGLILERGSLTTIAKNGTRQAFPFRDAKALGAIARKDKWNEYRIVCRGHRSEIHINGIHVSTLEDDETGKADLEGLIALQLHSGAGPAKIQFRNIHLTPFSPTAAPVAESAAVGIVPPDAPNIGFEKGDLSGWTPMGDAFEKQPAKAGSVAARNRGNDNADGTFFYGGYEFSGSDETTGSMVSDPFTVTHPWGGLRVGGGKDNATRVEIIDAASTGVIATVHGRGVEDMFMVSVDLRQHQGKQIQLRIVDEHSGAWGHVNYDDFRFHATQPGSSSGTSTPRDSPVLRHLRKSQSNAWLPPGFALETIDNEIRQPIAMAFDARGRIWIAEALAYPKRQPEGQGKDRLVILSDEDANGSFETRKVFIDNLNLVSGFEIGYGGVWVGAAPQMLFIPDRDRDDKPDGPPEVILDGFDTRDTHETPNSFMWGNDGWLYGCHGVFNNSRVGKPDTPDDKRVLLRAGIWRLHPKTHAFEIYAHGGSNQWGIDYDAEGNMLMTHCRSSWGKGPVSQVIRDGHYWTQNNSAHHPFIAAGKKGWNRSDSSLLNFLNGIAAYGHGEGGAGGPGSKAVFGGHSHVGSMVYLGHNWPAEYRGQLYTNNLHGAQMNRLFLSPFDAGLLAHTHGRDPLLIDNPQYLAVDLKYGPDGAVYIIDWADKQHCHTKNEAAWDRSSGALYRLKYAADFQPAPKLDLFAASEDELLGYLSHENEWYARMAQHVIRQGEPSATLQDAVRERLFEGSQRFRHLVALQASGGLRKADTDRLLADSADSIRAQTLHYLTETDASAYADRFAEIARTDDSARVRLALAGACQHRLSAEIAKPILEILADRSEDRNDRFIPKMIWYAYSKYPEADIKALKTAMPVLRQSIAWRVGDSVEVAAPPQQTQLQRGKASFLICSACHKPGLQLPGPALEDILGAYNDKAQLIAWMKKPVKKRPNYPEMPPFDKMDPQTLDDIATYLLSLRPAGAVQLTFENGTIDGWTTEGEAFTGQPIKGDTVSGRPHTPGDSINPVGDYWIGSYERHQDAAQGRMTSGPISVTSAKASFMVGGGKHPETRVEIVDLASGRIIHTAHGRNRETLHREPLDLSALLGGTIQIRLIDEHSGGWGHINFDDFRFEGRRVVGDLAADFTRGQPGEPNTHPNWHFHSDTDANPANGGLERLTWAKTGTEGNHAFAGTGTIFGRKSLGPLPSISDLGLYDRVKAAPAGTLAAHPGQTSGAPEYLVIEFRADSDLRGLQLDYRIDNAGPGGDGIDWRLLGPDGDILFSDSIDGSASENSAASIPDLATGQSLWLVIGNGPGDNPATDQTFLRLRLTAE